MRTFLFGSTLPLLAGSFLLSSCQEDLQPEVDRLESELTELRADLSREADRVREERKKNSELNKELRALEQEKKRTASEMLSLERQLADYQKQEEAIAAAEAKPDAAEVKAAAKEAATKHAQARVTITGDRSSGFGVVVEADGKNWIYLSPAVLSGNARLEVAQSSGTSLTKFGRFEILASGSLARLEITEEPDHAIPLASKGEIPSSARLISVTPSGKVGEGRVYSIKPDILSTDSRTRSSPAGTLVFLEETGEFVAVLIPESDDERELWPDNYRRSNPRTVALRMDQTGNWTPLAIGSFLEEARVLAQADQFTRLLAAFAVLRPAAGGVDYEASVGRRMSVKEVFSENKDLPVVRDFDALNTWLKESSKRAASQDIQKRISRVYDEIQRLAAKETKALTSQTFSPYHAAAAKQSIEWRQGAVRDMTRAAAAVNP